MKMCHMFRTQRRGGEKERGVLQQDKKKNKQHAT